MTNTLNKPRRRKPPQPVHGSCRWVGRPDLDDMRDGTAILEINGVRYWAETVEVGGRLVGARLTKWGQTESYDVDLGGEAGGGCSCPDDVFVGRPQGCKHRKALAVALPRLLRLAAPAAA